MASLASLFVQAPGRAGAAASGRRTARTPALTVRCCSNGHKDPQPATAPRALPALLAAAAVASGSGAAAAPSSWAASATPPVPEAREMAAEVLWEGAGFQFPTFNAPAFQELLEQVPELRKEVDKDLEIIGENFARLEQAPDYDKLRALLIEALTPKPVTEDDYNAAVAESKESLARCATDQCRDLVEKVTEKKLNRIRKQVEADKLKPPVIDPRLKDLLTPRVYTDEDVRLAEKEAKESLALCRTDECRELVNRVNMKKLARVKGDPVPVTKADQLRIAEEIERRKQVDEEERLAKLREEARIAKEKREVDEKARLLALEEREARIRAEADARTAKERDELAAELKAAREAKDKVEREAKEKAARELEARMKAEEEAERQRQLQQEAEMKARKAEAAAKFVELREEASKAAAASLQQAKEALLLAEEAVRELREAEGLAGEFEDVAATKEVMGAKTLATDAIKIAREAEQVAEEAVKAAEGGRSEEATLLAEEAIEIADEAAEEALEATTMAEEAEEEAFIFEKEAEDAAEAAIETAEDNEVEAAIAADGFDA